MGHSPWKLDAACAVRGIASRRMIPLSSAWWFELPGSHARTRPLAGQAGSGLDSAVPWAVDAPQRDAHTVGTKGAEAR